MTESEIRTALFKATEINPEILSHIHQNKWLHIWVPNSLGGLELPLNKGLKLLEKLAQIDGSLGWFVTLCSGANYFARNLEPSMAQKVFQMPDVCLGGSGMPGGKAEKTGNGFRINGLWHFATGAPYLTHFTLNAEIYDNGMRVLDEQNQPLIASFILEKNQVTILPTWKTMGMVATQSHSFEVTNQFVPESALFTYHQFYTGGVLNRLSFPVFADFTLLVIYLGMAKHYTEAASNIKHLPQIDHLNSYIQEIEKMIYNRAKTCEQILKSEPDLPNQAIQEIHAFGEKTVAELTTQIIHIHPSLGIKAACTNESINQVYRDFFTATQHKNFRSPEA